MNYQEILLIELSKKQNRNPSYSMRSFAKHLQISPALLSQLLKGEKRLTHRSAMLISKNLEFDPKQEKELLDKVSFSVKKETKADSRVKELSVDEFHLIADWEHIAILSLSKVAKNSHNVKWIAQRLGITTTQASVAFERLERLGYIKKTGKAYQQIIGSLSTSKDVSSESIRKYHRQNLEKATDSLISHPVEERYFGSETAAIDPDDLPAFKSCLRSFKKRFAKMAEKGKKKQVYHFSMQLFPIDKGDN